MKKEKLSFPKGSITFTPLDQELNHSIEKRPHWHDFLKNYIKRKKYVRAIEKTFPGPAESKSVTEEIFNGFMDVRAQLMEQRNAFKSISAFSLKRNYEITLKHPKWYPIIGDIKIHSNKESLKDALKILRKTFQERKKEARQIRMRFKQVKINSYNTNINYYVSGGTICMPEIKEGIFVKFLKDQEKKIVFVKKSPKDNNNYVGVELEFLCEANREKLGLLLFDAGLGKNVSLTEDASIRCCPEQDYHASQCPNHNHLYEHELCVLLKEDNYKEIMKKVCDVLTKTNAVVNKSCGMHVHLDMRNRDANKAYQNLVSSQNILFKMNPKSRTERYAKKSTSRNFLEVAQPRGGSSRYLGINAQAMAKHSTIEIRIHSGTTDFTKITNWIEILLTVANHSTMRMKNFLSLRSFCKEFKINDRLQEYMKERINKFKINKSSSGEITPEAERGVA